MKKANALQLRQNVGQLLDRLSRNREPILIERNRKPAAVLISIEDYRKRFVDVDADIRRRELVERIKASRIPLSDGKSSLDLIRDLRS